MSITDDKIRLRNRRADIIRWIRVLHQIELAIEVIDNGSASQVAAKYHRSAKRVRALTKRVVRFADRNVHLIYKLGGNNLMAIFDHADLWVYILSKYKERHWDKLERLK